ncbi:PIN domain-containing protein [Chryseobacterium cucumeris]
MKNIIIDTCVLVHIIRDSETGKKCLRIIEDYSKTPNIIISVVTRAEIESFSKQNNWGIAKVKTLNKLLSEFTIIDISKADNSLIENYALIDGYSKRKTAAPDGSLRKDSASKMGKNDLWIASTAATLNIPLVTCDGDFDHLNKIFIDLLKV